MTDSNLWLALMVGNSRLHWAWLTGTHIYDTWDTDHLPPKVIRQLFNCKTLEDFITHFSPSLPHSLTPSLPPSLLLASVVPSQSELWLSYPNVRVITLDRIPLQGLYPTLGIDRALALLGAGENWGFPVLVIDAGTALTFTGADANKRLVGGAILPGLGLQLATLAQKTGQLPMVELQEQLPQRFALKTEEAIQSGVLYTLVAGIKDFIEAWWRDYPEGKIVMTGGDRTLLIKYMQALFPDLSVHLYVEKNLIFWGMQAIIFNR